MVNLMQTSMKRAVLVLLAAAIVASAAQAAQPADGAGASSSDPRVAGYSPQELLAMSNSHPWVPGFRARYHAQAKKLALQELTAIANSHPHVGTSHLKELMATAASQPWVPGHQPRSHAHPSKLALQELTAIANSHPHVGTSNLKELMATASNSVPGAIISSVNVQKPVSASSGGFDWGDAGIGATSGFAFALILAGIPLFLLQRRSRGQGAGTPESA